MRFFRVQPMTRLWNFGETGFGEEGFDDGAVLWAQIVREGAGKEQGWGVETASDVRKPNDLIHGGAESQQVEPPASLADIQAL